MTKRKEFKSIIDIAKVLKELKKICKCFHKADSLDASNKQTEFVRKVLRFRDTENNDLENVANTIGLLAARYHRNVMSE